ncbi:hypothetical protein EUTSA_v10009628mg [Eutrema salsugineum]|uniref:Uncharacterized protein n=1 Tax=Eutrema salsugineum TaxID=72664 RepID=V4KQZ0_EUTSA|nr:putative F-box protein At1g31072 [Eutrema salsugineum]ESQ33704.1 hypothetical protein EUTSA_v10009628mg [Eutrema salsugineum]
MKRGVKILDSFPIDLFLEIFSRLPSKSIARFRCLWKLWGSMLHRQYFTELFLTRSWARPRLLFILEGHHECSVFSSPQLQNPYGKSSSSLVVSAGFHMKSAYLRGFTSGLIYCYDLTERGYKVLNPSTGRCASMPKLTSGLTSYLGFDPIDKQFKLLSISYCSWSDEIDDHSILTLGTGEMTWRKIQCPLTYDLNSREICINGVLYYLAHKTSKEIEEIPLIVCFDVRTEKFKFIELEDWFFYDATLINY